MPRGKKHLKIELDWKEYILISISVSEACPVYLTLFEISLERSNSKVQKQDRRLMWRDSAEGSKGTALIYKVRF